jgi:hypothetical protein
VAHVGATDAELTADKLREIADALPEAVGARCPEPMMATLGR